MSVFFSERYAQLEPYTPGEQPQDRRYIKLNTNESPFPPSPGVLEAVREEAGRLQLYSDPESRTVTCALAEHYGLQPDQVLVGNGSDELLNFAFMAYCDDACPALFPDVTYGFYPVFAALNRIPMIEVPLREDFSVCIDDYLDLNGTVFLANPNAPQASRSASRRSSACCRQGPRTCTSLTRPMWTSGPKASCPSFTAMRTCW